MERREFLKGMTIAGLGSSLVSAHAGPQMPEGPGDVKTVFVVTKCHLDIGFTNTERNVLLTYFNDYIPRTMKLAEKLRLGGGEERYVWTLAAWMIYEYLEQASSEDRSRMERAIGLGDIAWHAAPFTWQSEMLDRSLISSALMISGSLDKRFGKRTIAAKFTDVPGHTRGIIAPFSEAGITFIDIGDNPGCKGPAVPFMASNPGQTHSVEDTEVLDPGKAKIVADLRKYGLSEKEARRLISDSPFEEQPSLFNWRNPEGAQVMVLYHPLGYGSTVAIPGTDIGVSIRVATDNSGPHSAEEVRAYYASLRRSFPTAKIVACNLSDVATALQVIQPRLPVVTQEIGDTWIYGVASDPGKVAQYRELSRLRREWLSKGKFQAGGSTDLPFVSRLILGSEHNWGLSTGEYLGHPDVYSPDELMKARISRPEFQRVDDEWASKRRDMHIAITTLRLELQEEASERLQSLVPKPPTLRSSKPLQPGSEIQSPYFGIALDSATGAIVKLRDLKSGREWASQEHPLAGFRYEMFEAASFARFNSQYNTAKFASNDFGKPGMDKYPVKAITWQPVLRELAIEENAEGHLILAGLNIEAADDAVENLFSWPRRLSLELWLPKNEPAVYATFQCFDKRANRLAEAMWLSFSPDAPDQEGWTLEKVDQPVSPHDVMINGNRHLHAVTKTVRYHDPRGSFTLETLDAPLVAPGQRSLLKFDNDPIDMRGGIHVNLYNNLWGTAFPQWYDQDMRFRFVIRLGAADDR